MIYLLACFGATFALCDSSFFSWFRTLVGRLHFFKEMLACYFCTGFWVSLGLACLLFPLDAWVVARALAGAAVAYVLNTAQMAVESVIMRGYDGTETH